MTDITRTAVCGCGDVAIDVAGEPDFEAICACSECRSRTGSAFGLSAYFPASAVSNVRGEPTVYRRRSDADRTLDFRFCGRCGTTVWWTAEFLPDKIGVAAALIEGLKFKPNGAYFCADIPGWLSFDPSIPIAARARTGS